MQYVDKRSFVWTHIRAIVNNNQLQPNPTKSTMIKRIKKLKKIRLHREGTDTLVYGFIAIVAIALLLWRFCDNKAPFWCFTAVFGVVYCIVINFFRCPIRYFPQEDTEKIVVAPADGRVVVIEEVDEDTYFHDRRIDVCAFRKGRVRFCSSFEVTLTPDAVYYILNVWQTLGMKRTDVLCLAGSITGHEALIKELRRFIKNIRNITI